LLYTAIQNDGLCRFRVSVHEKPPVSAKGPRSMRSDEKVELLTRVDLFEALSHGQILRLSWTLPVISLRSGRLLHGPDHQGDIFYLLLRGRVRIYKAFGKVEATLSFVSAGDMFGEGAFRSPPGRRGSFVQAVENSEIALMRVDVFGHLAREEPALALKMVEVLSDRLAFYADRVADAGSKDVTGRLSTLILHLSESEGVVTHEGYRIPIRYTHQQLGEMIGATRVAVTRALGDLREAGIIVLDHRQIHVRDLEVLRRVTEK
jgi:CRP/FNR family transcriptional regulator, cyclic AMP receptor protein